MKVLAHVEVNPTQAEFISSPATYPGFIGGYGSGKTTGGQFRGFDLKFKFPKGDVAIYAPTYPLLQGTWFPRLEEFATKYGLKFFLNKANKEFFIQGFGKFILRSMDNPQSIISYEVSDSLVDEIDTMPKDKAEDCWKRIIARNRQVKPKGQKNTAAVMTTPEGFRFAYDRWGKNPSENYVMYKARTDENVRNLPDEYIPNLVESFDPVLLSAYRNGDFVNLTQGSIYYAFSETLHMSKVPLLLDPTLPVNLCVDFNVNPMIWTIAQHRDRSDIRILHEIKRENTNTPAMCKEVLSLFEGKAKDLNLVVYGDASGEHRDTRSNSTDYTIIDQELRPAFNSLKYKVPASNPAVENRVKCMNSRLAKPGALVINPECKELRDDMIQCVRNKHGEIDKSDLKRTHASDGVGYYVAVEFPIIERKYAEVRLL